MELSPDMKNVVFTAVGAAAATAVAAIPTAWKRLRKDIGDEAVRRQTEIAMAEKLGAQGVRIDGLQDDLNGVAAMVRKRFEKLEKKDTALETLLTGELPRISGESEAAQ
jgi:uncharacterized protein (DUF4213/DUF364 family)